jgi:hypothetical protein
LGGRANVVARARRDTRRKRERMKPELEKDRARLGEEWEAHAHTH